MIQKWWVLASVACGTFMATLDSSIVNIALPTLTKELNADLYRVKWVIIVYLLFITCLLLPFGRLSDQVGRKRIFQFGFLIFIGGSFLCGWAPTLSALVLFRALQAVGASMLMANGPAIVTSTFSHRERGAALGILAMVVSAGLVTGPSVGGLLITHFGWRSIFFANIPIGILGIGLVQFFVKKDQLPKTGVFFDWAGAFLQTVILSLFIFLLDPPHISVSGSVPMPVARWALAVSLIVLFLIFVKVEREVKNPLFDLSLLENRTFWAANLASFLMFVAFSSVGLLMPFFLEEVLHFAPQNAGFFMTAIPFTIFISAPFSGRASDRFGSHGLSFAGSLIGAIGLFAMAGAFGSGINRDTPYFWILLGLGSVGLATGLFQSPNNNTIMGSVPHNKLGVASALLATVRNLGLATGTGLATSLFTEYRANGELVQIESAFHIVFMTSGFVALGALAASFGKKREIHKEVHGGEKI